MPLLENVEIDLEMNHPNDLVLVHAVQGEYYSRQVTANLKLNGSAYTIPANTVAMVRFRRPDGRVGFYDFDPAGNRIVTISGTSQVVLTLAYEMCAVKGRVAAHIDLYSIQNGTRLSAFYFYVDVEKAATDPEIYQELNVTGVQDLLTDILGNVYTPGSSVTGVIVDNTLSIPGAVSDAKAVGTRIDDLVLAQANQPNVAQHPGNVIWIDTAPTQEYEVPTIDEHNALLAQLNALTARVEALENQL